jgi:Family of unknown function (DUF6221)
MSEVGEIAAWLRAQAEADIEAANAATPGPWEFEGDDPTDDELYSTRDENLLPTVAWTRDRNVANGRHMERHDPLTETARAESVLAVLDDYARTAAIANPPQCPQGEIAGRDYLDAKRELAALDHVVRLLAYGYRRREGFKGEWRS